jgi:hypothetical protein
VTNSVPIEVERTGKTERDCKCAFRTQRRFLRSKASEQVVTTADRREQKMKANTIFTLFVGAMMILTAPVAALAAPGGIQGPPGGGSTGDAAGALYGDLYVIERDDSGVPVTVEVTYPELDENGEPTGDYVTVQCQQPLAADCSLLPLWGQSDVFDPELYDACAVQDDYADFLQGVAFGRESVGRSPASVLDSSYGEALKTINLAVESCDSDVAIKKDPAGRVMLCLATEEDGTTTYAWKTIDAPLENLGMYRAVMTDGCMSPIDETVIGEEGQPITVTIELTESAEGFLGDAGLGHVVCQGADLPDTDDMLSAAVFIGAAADKTSPVTIDEVINMNTYLGINPYEYTRQGKNRTLEVTYFDFTGFDYVFGTDACVAGTLAGLLTVDGSGFVESIVDVFAESPPGVDLRGEEGGVAITVCRDGAPVAVNGDEVVCDGAESFVGEDEAECGGANYFAQAAEDARKTIWYLHNWRVPEVAY